MTPLMAAYVSCSKRLTISFDDFCEALKDWEVIPVKVRGEMAGAILCNGPELHVCVIEKYFKKWCTPSLYRRAFTERKKKYGFLRTSMTRGNLVGRAFVERLGFRLVKILKDIEIYEVR